MLATLRDIQSKPSTPGRERAAANIQAALARMDAYAANQKSGGGFARAITFHDRETLKLLVDDPSRCTEVRDRAKRLLDGNGELTRGDVRFLDAVHGDDR
ncbi:hypothetical protein SAMN05444279_1463 [Ruegeria intermedia]|uniref:Uncharacterized protein n=2 Tax=Ruegeria intermedia TaxID=996115 RepID=A0A1M5BP44_9RHOB|nr:hypothetical protein SAMN05444279_1463 [Ruegeria intermedia]